MNVKAKKKRRLVLLLTGSLGVVALGGGAYAVRSAQIERRARASRAEGLEALKSEDYFTAMHKVGAYLQRHPDDPDALYAYAQARAEVEEPDNKHIPQAIRLYVRLLDLQPQNLEARHRLLDLYERTGFGSETVAAAEEVLKSNPADAAAVRAQAVGYARTNQFDKALKCAMKYNELAPDDLVGYATTFDLMLRAKQPADAVVKRADELRKAHPDDGRFELLQSIAAAMAGKTEDAASWARRAAAHPPRDAESVVMLAGQLENLGVRREDPAMFAESLKVLGGAADAAPGAPQERRQQAGALKVRRALASRWWQLGNYERVAEYLKGLDPADKKADAELLALRATALIKSNRAAEAQPIVAALAARQGDAAAAAWSSVIPVVVVPAGGGPATQPVSTAATAAAAEPRRAVEACLKAVERVPDSPYFRNYLGEAYARLGEVELARLEFTRALRAAPAWAEPLVRMSRVLAAMGDAVTAREAARQASLRSPDSVEAMALQATAWAGALTGPDDAAKLLAFVEQVQGRAPNEEQTLPLRVALVARLRTPAAAGDVLKAALAATPAPSEAALLRLASVSREYKLGLEDLCLDRAEKAYGVTPDLALVRARLADEAGRRADALRGFEAALAAHGAANPRSWKVARARLLDRVADPRAASAWVELADGFPADAEVQQLALGARAVQPDRAFLDRTVARLREASGGQGVRWRLARAQLLLTNKQRSEQDLAEATTVLNEVIKATPDLLAARLLMADAQEALRNDKEAIQQLEVAINLSPASNAIALRLARLWQQQGDASAARQYVDRARANKTLAPSERREAAALLSTLGDAAGALAVLNEGGARATTTAPAGGTDVAGDLLLAGLLRDNNKPDEARAIYERLLASDAVNPAVVGNAAAFYAARGDKARAEQTLARLDATKAPPGERESVRGQYLLRYGEPLQALEQFQAAVKANPADAASWRSLIVCALAVGKTDEAADASGRAAAAVPEKERGPFQAFKQNEALVKELAADDVARLVMPGLLGTDDESSAAAETLKGLAAGRRNKAPAADLAAQLRKVADRHPRYLPLHVILAQNYLSSRQSDEALALAQRSMQLHPKAPEPARLVVEALTQKAMSTDRRSPGGEAVARQRWNDVLDAARSWRARSGAKPLAADQVIATCALALGQPGDAIKQLQPYTDRAKADPAANAQLLTLMAQSHIAAGKPDDAAALLRPMLKGSTQWRATWVQLAGQNIGRSDAARAAAWLKEAEDAAGPGAAAADRVVLAQGWFLLAQETGDAAQTAAAKAAVATAAKQAAGEANVPPAALLSLGMLHEGLGDIPAAEATYRRVLQQAPNATVALNNLAMILVNRGGSDLDAAGTLATKAVELNPGVASFQDTLAAVQAKRKQYDQAVVSMQNAVRLEPAEVKWRIALGGLLLDAGQPDKAKAVLAEIDAMRPDATQLDPAARQRLDALRASVQGRQARS